MNVQTLILPDGREIIPIHLVVIPKYGQPRIVCMPGLQDLSSGRFKQSPVMRTDEPRSVTCPMCKASPDFPKVPKK